MIGRLYITIQFESLVILKAVKTYYDIEGGESRFESLVILKAVKTTQLGILKAMGYSRFSVAKHFWKFGLSVFFGAIIGFGAAYLYMPTFYRVQNADGLLPEIAVRFHFELLLYLVVFPTLMFVGLAVLYAFRKLKAPVLNLLRESCVKTTKAHKEKDGSFLKGLRGATLKSKKLLVFLITFSAFCFSSMVQMSLSMSNLASEAFAWMILMIGLILAFMTLFMSLSSAVKAMQRRSP